MKSRDSSKRAKLPLMLLPFEATGKERVIEVKTTAFGKETPFLITRGEVAFAKEHDDPL